MQCLYHVYNAGIILKNICLIFTVLSFYFERKSFKYETQLLMEKYFLWHSIVFVFPIVHVAYYDNKTYSLIPLKP